MLHWTQADNSGNTALHTMPLPMDWLECVQLLLTYGADPFSSQCLENYSHHHCSPENHTCSLSKTLLKAVKESEQDGKDNAQSVDEEGRTLLILVVGGSNLNRETADFVEELVREQQKGEGDVTNVQDAKGRTALYHLVSQYDSEEKGSAGRVDRQLSGVQDCKTSCSLSARPMST